MNDSEFCYVDTEDGRLWGIYRGTQQILEPIYDTITPVLDKRALNMPVQTSIKRNRTGLPNQRLGIEEASEFIISHTNSDWG